jgi:hypothetical protein
VVEHTRFAQDNDTRVCIVIDEVGRYPNFLRGLCRVWSQTLRTLLKNKLMVKQDHLFLIVVGTGAENFQVSTVGSLPSSFVLYAMRSTKRDSEPLVFRQLLEALVKKRNRVARSVQTLLFESATNWKPKITDEVTLRFHELIRNPRCAALACRLIYEHWMAYYTSFTQVTKDECAQSVRSMLPLWAHQIVIKFANNNGLQPYYEEGKAAHVIGKAIAIVRDHVITLARDTWQQLAVDCGLLTDSVFKISSEKFERESDRYIKVPVVEDVDKGVREVFVCLSNQPRFRLSDPAVAIFLLTVTPTISGAAMASQSNNSDWSLFEILVADYLTVCGLSPRLDKADGVSTNNNNQVAIDDSAAPGNRFSRPRDIFTVPHDQHRQVHRAFLTSKLEPTIKGNTSTDDATINNNNNDVEESIKIKLERLSELKQELRALSTELENDLVILINGDKAEFADVIAVSRNRIFLIQCKYYEAGSLTLPSVKKEFLKMEKLEMLDFLAESIRGEQQVRPRRRTFLRLNGRSLRKRPQKPKIEVVSVVLALNEDSFTGPVTSDINLLKARQMVSTKFTFNIKRHVSCVVPRSTNKNMNNNNLVHGGLYPVMRLCLHTFWERKKRSLLLDRCSANVLVQIDTE